MSLRQCLCEWCTNMDLMLDALNPHIVMCIDGRDELSDISICDLVSTHCLQQNCDDCGTDFVRELIVLKPNPPASIKWQVWDFVSSGHSAQKRRERVTREGSLEMLCDELMLALKEFSQHLHNFRWQYSQYKTIKTNLPQSWALITMDFAENFLLKQQDEVQSAHWAYSQVTVHPCVLHYKCPSCPEQVTDYLLFFSDDMVHDAHIVQIIQRRTVDHLKSLIALDKVVIFSDGAASQYKSKLPFYYLLSNDNIVVERCYFGSRHGKSQCDSAGGTIKRLLEEDVHTGVKIPDAETMFKHSDNIHCLGS